MVVDRAARIGRMNAAAEKLFGYAREELIGKDHDLLVPERLKDRHERKLKAYMEQPRVRVMGIGLELRGRRKDGTEFPADIDLGPIEMDHNRCVLAVVRDATRRKELEEDLEGYRQRLEQIVAERTAEFAKANAKLEQEMEEHRKAEEGLALRASILDNAGEPVFLVNPRGDFVYANAAAAETYGYSLDEFLVMNLSQLLKPGEGAVIRERLEEVLKSGRLIVEATHVRKDNSSMSVQVRHTLTKTSHGQFIVSVVRQMA